MPRSAVSVSLTDTKTTDALLANLPIELRGKTLTKAIRKAGNEVAKEARRRLTANNMPGYPGDKPDKPPIAKTVKTVVRMYGVVVAAFVGPTYPDAAHSHLLEFGHRVVLPRGKSPRKRKSGEPAAKTFVKGRPYLRPAADLTKGQQQAAIIETLKKGLSEIA